MKIRCTNSSITEGVITGKLIHIKNIHSDKMPFVSKAYDIHPSWERMRWRWYESLIDYHRTY